MLADYLQHLFPFYFNFDFQYFFGDPPTLQSPNMIKARTRPPPDFSFPPKRKPDTSIAHAAQTPPSTAPDTSKLHDLRHVPASMSKSEDAVAQEPTPTPHTHSPFLAIPIEIRLHIYSYVLASHPVFHAHLAPQPEPFSSLNDPQLEDFHTSIIRPLGRSSPTTSVLTTNASPAKPQQISALYPLSAPTLVGSSSSQNLRGKIPTGLLSSCKQVYEESRMIPWENNTFSFINWFWSGVYAARQFTRGLRPWQSENIRWVGVEVLGRDLAGATGAASTTGMVSKWGVVESNTEDSENKKKSEWIELCGLWEGVWGLRLGIKGGLAAKKSEYVEESGAWVRPEDIAFREANQVNNSRKGVLDVEKDWVQHGLLHLRSLRWLYLEIEDGEISREDKLLFCADLEGLFNSPEDRVERWKKEHGSGYSYGYGYGYGSGSTTRVVFVERRRRESVKNGDFEWFGGEAGDESVGAVDDR